MAWPVLLAALPNVVFPGDVCWCYFVALIFCDVNYRLCPYCPLQSQSCNRLFRLFAGFVLLRFDLSF